MSDQQDSGDEIQIISHKFRSVTTIEPAFNVAEQGKTLKMNNSGTSSSVSDGNSLIRNLPELNLPEKILFVVDTVRERNFTPFKLGTGAKYTPLFMIKRVVEQFICAKSTIQRSHEYALMTLDSQGAEWICDFTNNTKSIANHLDTIVEDVLEEDQKTYDLGQLFETMQTRLPVPVKHRGTTVSTFVTRIIFIYARSSCFPKFHTSQKSLDELAQNPYFFLDMLYVHEPPCSENMCEEIYAEIAKLNGTDFSYILEVGRNAAKLHENMAKLLAHPLQRPPQKDACYTVYSPTGLQEIHTNV